MTSFNEKSQDSVQGVLVQEIPNVKAIQKMQGDADIELASGVMRVLLVTFDVNNPFNDPTNEPSLSQKERAVEPESVDMWVVLEIGSNFSFPVRANQTIVPQRDTSSYTFPSADVSGAAISLVLSSDRYSSSIEQFEDLLTDYCAFQSDAKGRGTIELMDEKGHLLGTIDGPWHLEEDAGLHKSGYEKDPVLVELPPESSSSSGSFDQKIIISTAPRTEEGIIASEYQNDWLLKGATFVSKSLITGSTWAGQKMTNAADSYVSKTTPPMSRQSSTPGDYEKNPSQLSSDSSKPLTTSGRPAVTFSPKVYAASQQIKAFSGTATAVSGRTRDAVLNVAGKVGDQIGKTTGIQAQPRADGTATKPSGIRGVLNRSLIAANVVLDGLTQSAETLLSSGGEASGRAIEHRYGSEAKIISGNTASVGRSAFVVYKDINGVRRKALLKIATGTIKARAPDGSEVILQQENFQSPSAQASATVTDPPAYEKDSKADYRNDLSQLPSSAKNSVKGLDSPFNLANRALCSLPFDFWDLYEAAPLPNTPRHHRISEFWHSPFESFERLSSSPCSEEVHNNGSNSCQIQSKLSLIAQSPHFRVPLFPRTPTTAHRYVAATAATPFVSKSPHYSPANNFRVSTMTPSSNSAFNMQMIQCCGGGRIQHPLRRMKLRTPSQLRITITPKRVMGLGKSTLDSNCELTTWAVDSTTWNGSSASQDDTTIECNECEDGLISPLLKASQESAGRNIDRLCYLTRDDDIVEADTSVQAYDNTLSLLRQMRRRDERQDEDPLINCTKKKPKLHYDGYKMDDSDPFFTLPSSSTLSPAKSAKGRLGEQIVDAASILLSIGQGEGLQTGFRHHNWPVVKHEEIEDDRNGEESEEESEDDYEISETASSPCHDNHHLSNEKQPVASKIRLFPNTIPINLDEFPLLYQRYRVPSSIAISQHLAVFGEDTNCIKDDDLRKIARRGIRKWGSWHDPRDALDLYTPRWVRGSLKDKMGLCTICYEESPSKMIWKRTKTSEYNYHLINQHGISPQTLRPYDPPIAFKTREQSSTSAGHRKTIIQGKCHACKKYIDMQGKYTGKVKVPEIYWWKHARKCHKGRKDLPGTGGTFVEDKFYHRVVASMEKK